MGNVVRTLEATLWLGALASGIVLVSLYAEGKLPPLPAITKSSQPAKKERIEDILSTIPAQPLQPAAAPKVIAQKEVKPAPPKVEPIQPKAELPETAKAALAPAAKSPSRSAPAILRVRRTEPPIAQQPVHLSWYFKLSKEEQPGNPSAEPSTFQGTESTIYFPFGSSALSDSASEALRKVAVQSASHKKILIRAFTDGIGTACDNQKLSARRAQSISGYLVSQGVPPGKISLFALGPQNALSSNDSPGGRSRNRRAEVFILG